ncbi:MAG TPA: 50S ribosomal protein L25/general stress protein Ctc [Alphaproteobacteria bacterium]|nr:50S ribosomal protein L25/general stress protein Ctc [Alphaproteobacteria bacterium]
MAKHVVHPIQTIEKSRNGKGAAREMRRQGYVPAVIYTPGKQNENVTLGLLVKDLNRALQVGHFFTHAQELKIADKVVKVLAREIQRHPVTDKPVHIDFMSYDAARQVNVNVTVNIVGETESPGLKEGGVLQLIEAQLEVVCRADSIPEQIEVSVAGLEIGDTVHLSSIKLPEGVRSAVTDRDLTIVSIISTRTSNTADDEAADAAAAAAAAPADGSVAPAGAAAAPAADAKPAKKNSDEKTDKR